MPLLPILPDAVDAEAGWPWLVGAAGDKGERVSKPRNRSYLQYAFRGIPESRATKPHYAAKADRTQAPILAAVRAAGWECYLLRNPVDLVCIKGGRLNQPRRSPR